MPAFDAEGDPIVPITGHVRRSVRERFAARARALGLTTAAALRQFVMQEAGEGVVAPVSGSAQKITLRLRDPVRARLRQEAEARGTTPTAWATAMLEAQVLNRPQWNRAELAELRLTRAAVAGIHARMNDGEAAAQVDAAIKRIDAAISGNLAYWGRYTSGPNE